METSRFLNLIRAFILWKTTVLRHFYLRQIKPAVTQVWFLDYALMVLKIRLLSRIVSLGLLKPKQVETRILGNFYELFISCSFSVFSVRFSRETISVKHKWH